MGTNPWLMVMFLVQLLSFAAWIWLWNRYRSLTDDEGRLRHGLQILTSKIAILEDLSHRVDEQSAAFSKILDSKGKQIESLMTEVEDKLSQLSQTLAIIDTDPEELAERQNTIRLTKAAILAHRGFTPKEIAEKTGLGYQESELIWTLNKDRLQFEPDSLPEWLKKQLGSELEIC